MAPSAAGAQAQKFPQRPVRLVVAVPPGNGADTVARAIAQRLSDRWGRSVIVDNRSGAGGAIAMDLVARAAADGHTLLFASIGLVTTATLLKKVDYDTLQAYTPIAQMTVQPYLLAVNPALPFASVKDIIVYARNNPGALNYASSGTGSGSHLGMERLKRMAGVDIVHVPYKGSAQAVTELASGQVQLLFANAVTAMPFVRSGRFRLVAVASAGKSRAFPDLPTVAEGGLAGFELSTSYSLFGPDKMPAVLAAAINREHAVRIQSVACARSGDRRRNAETGRAGCARQMTRGGPVRMFAGLFAARSKCGDRLSGGESWNLD
jgi:tripartite-type tricarboxylate transporter receptor subunit TctC